MKKQLIIALALLPTALLSTTVLAASRPDQCALNSTCSFSIRGKFNKVFRTPGLQAGQTYVCKVIRGPGRLLSLSDFYVSQGVSYQLQGKRFNKPLIIRGPSRGTGYIQYTIYNNNDPWHTDSIQFKCSAKG